MIHTAYQRPDLSDDELAKLVEMAPWICETVVDGEDFWVAGRTEPGLSTGLVETVVFGRNEPAPQHLHKAFRADDRRGRARGLSPVLEVLPHVCVQDDLENDGEALAHACSAASGSNPRSCCTSAFRTTSGTTARRW